MRTPPHTCKEGTKQPLPAVIPIVLQVDLAHSDCPVRFHNQRLQHVGYSTLVAESNRTVTMGKVNLKEYGYHSCFLRMPFKDMVLYPQAATLHPQSEHGILTMQDISTERVGRGGRWGAGG